MQRRDVLKLLGSAAAISALPQEALTVLAQASAQAAQLGRRKTLNPHQNADSNHHCGVDHPQDRHAGCKGR